MTHTANWTISDNADWVRRFLLTDRETEAALDLTDSTFEMDVRTAAAASSVAATLTTENGGIVISATPTDGKIDVVFGEGDLDPGLYVYDLVRRFGSGQSEVVMSGHITVEQGVSR